LAQAFVDASDDDTTLLQAQFLPLDWTYQEINLNDPNTIGPLVSALADRDALTNAEAAEALRSYDIFAELPGLPPYQLVGFADYHHPELEIVTVALVYDIEADAEVAAQALAARLPRYAPNFFAQDFTALPEIFPDIEFLEPQVYAGSEGGYVAMMTMQVPAVDLLTEDMPLPGRLMRLLNDSIMRRTAYLIWNFL